MSNIIKVFKNSKILLPIFILSIILSAFLYIFIPKIIEQSVIKNIVQNSTLIVKRLQIQREYYVNSVVGDVKKYAKDIEFSYSHKGIDGKLPFPTTMIHDLSELYSKNSDVKISLYSNYPFLNRKDRVLSSFQKNAIKEVENSNDGIYFKKDIINNKEVLRVALADKMVLNACVNCHNTHKLKNWDFDWKLGDTRGVLEVITPIQSALGDIKIARNNILITVILMMFSLIFYYTYTLLKRENQLVKEKDTMSEDYDKQLYLQSRNAQMGEMIANIAHQWRQPLNVITTAVSSMQLQKHMNFDDDNFDKLCDTILNNSKYLSNTIDDFRGYIIGSKQKEYFKIEDNINKFLHIIDANVKMHNIKIIVDIKNNIEILSYPNELIQCYINIVNNAVDILKNPQIQNKYIFISSYILNDELIIEFKDNAGGIPENIIEKVFDPYFTTKHQSQGTGLGLYMTYKMIKNKINGKINVNNTQYTHDKIEYKGALFTIKLSIK